MSQVSKHAPPQLFRKFFLCLGILSLTWGFTSILWVCQNLHWWDCLHELRIELFVDFNKLLLNINYKLWWKRFYLSLLLVMPHHSTTSNKSILVTDSVNIPSMCILSLQCHTPCLAHHKWSFLGDVKEFSKWKYSFLHVESILVIFTSYKLPSPGPEIDSNRLCRRLHFHIKLAVFGHYQCWFSDDILNFVKR